MKVAVLGSNSFSGSDFIDLLLAPGGHDVLGISRSPEKSALFLPYKARELANFKFVQADLNHESAAIVDALDTFAPEYIVNFAAQSEVGPSWISPADWFQTNTVALANLINELRTRPYLKRYVHISSPEVYGTCDHAVTEDQPMNPSTPYAASKAAADFLLKTFVAQFDFPAVFIRATNVYGAHQQLFKIIPRSVIYLRSGRTIQLHGGGYAVKSYIHIRDVSEGTLSAMTSGTTGDIYHLSPDAGYQVADVVREICEKTGYDFETATETTDDRPGQDAAYVIDSQKARNHLGWSPKVSLSDGLGTVIEWIDNNWPAIQDEPHEYVHKP